MPTLQWRLKKLKIFKSKISLHLFFDLLEHDFHLFFLSPSSWKERKKLSPKRESEKLNFFYLRSPWDFLAFQMQKMRGKKFQFPFNLRYLFFLSLYGSAEKSSFASSVFNLLIRHRSSFFPDEEFKLEILFYMPSSSTLSTMKKFFFSLFLLYKSCEISEILKQKKGWNPSSKHT